MPPHACHPPHTHTLAALPPPPPSSSSALPPAAGDWLQGPYVYHLYEVYGFSVKDIGLLFIVGFGSSALLGTLVGALADIW